jgi:hypothetical protein
MIFRFATRTKRILQGLTEDPSQANAQAAVEFFREILTGRSTC